MYRSKKLLESVRDMECQLCGKYGQTVPAHANWQQYGKGVLPLSYRRWPGSWDPAAVGLTPWDFTLLFGRHLPGGGPAEPTDEEALARKLRP